MSIIPLFFAELFILFLLSRHLTRELSQLFYSLTKSMKWTIYILAFIFLPGTFVHELSHYLMAVLLRVPVGGFEMIPKMQSQGNVKLGSVSIAQSDLIRRLTVGAAPFLFGVIIIFSSFYLAEKFGVFNNFWSSVFVLYIVFVIGNTMYSSKKDLEGALNVITFLIVTAFIGYLLGFSFPQLDQNVIFSANVLAALQKADLFLSVPIFIDGILLMLLRLRKFKL